MAQPFSSHRCTATLSGQYGLQLVLCSGEHEVIQSISAEKQGMKMVCVSQCADLLTLILQRAKVCPPVQRLPQRPEGKLTLIIDISWIKGRMFITLQDHRNAACLHGTRPLQQRLPKGVRKYMSSSQKKQLEITEKKNGLIVRNLVV